MSQSNTAERPLPAPSSVVQRPAKGKATGLTTLGKDATREAQRLATAILEVLAGVRSPAQAAQALGLSLVRYYQVEGRALHGLVGACEPKPRGRSLDAARELTALRRQHERVQRELARQQALVRLAGRAVGLAPGPTPTPAATTRGSGKKARRRRPAVRALTVAARLQTEPAMAEVPAAPAGTQEGAERSATSGSE